MLEALHALEVTKDLGGEQAIAGRRPPLLVDESQTLHDLVKKMVSSCKGIDAKVDDFLADAIRNELKNWEQE